MKGKCHRAGFTLVELLVASAITVVLAGIMIAIVAQVARTWARASGGLTANQQAEFNPPVSLPGLGRRARAVESKAFSLMEEGDILGSVP